MKRKLSLTSSLVKNLKENACQGNAPVRFTIWTDQPSPKAEPSTDNDSRPATKGK